MEKIPNKILSTVEGLNAKILLQYMIFLVNVNDTCLLMNYPLHCNKMKSDKCFRKLSYVGKKYQRKCISYKFLLTSQFMLMFFKLSMNTSNTKCQSLAAHIVKIVLSVFDTNLSKNQILTFYTEKLISELKELLFRH